MMNDNYAIINGKKIELTEEQLKQLGDGMKKKKRNPNDMYFSITSFNEVARYRDHDDESDSALYDAVNYFTDEAFANQVALHQLLYRKLLKFAYDNGYEDRLEWNGTTPHWAIRHNETLNKFVSFYQDGYKAQGVYFSSGKGAEQAIAEVVEPFMKEHPEFVW